MNAWRWWWCFLLILQLGNAEHISLHDEKEKNAAEHKEKNYKSRERRDSEWFEEDVLNDEDENSKQLYPLSTPSKRKPILSSWGGKRLSEFLYYKRKPAFSSWGGKRGPAFSSWGGKRSEGNNFNKHNLKIHNITSDSLPDENTAWKGDTSKYEQIFNFPAEHDLYQMLQSKYSDEDSTGNEESFKKMYNTQEIQPFLTQNFENNDEQNLNLLFSQNEKNNQDQQYYHDLLKSISNQPTKDTFLQYENDETENEDLEDLNYAKDTTTDLNFEDGTIELSNIFDKKSSPSLNKFSGKRMPAFNSWGGKRAPAFNSWGGKRSSKFNSWGGKRMPAFNSWGGKRGQAFNTWGGKRMPAFNSWGGKRAPAFNSWGGKRAPAFNSWGGKRLPAFNSWGGKRDIDSHKLDEENSETQLSTQRKKRSLAYNNLREHNSEFENLDEKQSPSLSGEGKTTEEFDDWRVNRDPSFLTDYESRASDTNEWENTRNAAFNSKGGKRAPAFNSWGGKRAPSFNSWGGKRAPSFSSWGGKRVPAFNSWGGKRAPAFNSWGGKRAPAFNSWGGKRAPAFNSWGGKRAPAFNSWGGKRAPAFNSWGGKRAPAFNSWGGKRAPAFNSWGGKRAPAFNSWGGKRVPAFNSWGGKRNADNINNKLDTSYSFTGKRLPAFHSWGGKRSDISESNLSDLNGEESFSDVNIFLHPDSKNDESVSLNSEAMPDPEDNFSPENNDSKLDKLKNVHPFFLKDDSVQQQEKLNNKMKSVTLSDPKNSQISITKRDGEGKRNPAFFSWGGKRSDALKHLYFLHDDESNNENLQKNNELFSDEEDNSNNENHFINKRSAELNNNFDNLPHFLKSGYTEKQKSEFSSWDGKGKEQFLDNQNNADIESSQPITRTKRYIDNNAALPITLVADSNTLDNIISSDIDSLSSEDIFPELPTGTMMCCMKRVQYGDRNLFMQMLLRTKSFRDLSWPTIRPIRRGSDFYPWGGKRSSL